MAIVRIPSGNVIQLENDQHFAVRLSTGALIQIVVSPDGAPTFEFTPGAFCDLQTADGTRFSVEQTADDFGVCDMEGRLLIDVPTSPAAKAEHLADAIEPPYIEESVLARREYDRIAAEAHRDSIVLSDQERAACVSEQITELSGTNSRNCPIIIEVKDFHKIPEDYDFAKHGFDFLKTLPALVSCGWCGAKWDSKVAGIDCPKCVAGAV